MSWGVMNRPGRYGCYAAAKRAAKAFAQRSGQAAMILYAGPRKGQPYWSKDLRLVNHYVWGNGKVDVARDGKGRYIDHPKSRP